MNHFVLFLVIFVVVLLGGLFLFRKAIKRDIEDYKNRMEERNKEHLAQLQYASRAINNAASDVSKAASDASSAAKALGKGL